MKGDAPNRCKRPCSDEMISIGACTCAHMDDCRNESDGRVTWKFTVTMRDSRGRFVERILF
jgi:hypothetical protein